MTGSLFGVAVALSLWLLGALSVHAQATPQRQIERQLVEQGYSVQSVERTLLRRIRIRAVRGRDQREVIFNPRTGEILRDYTRRRASGEGGDDDLARDGGTDDQEDTESQDDGDGGRDDDDDGNQGGNDDDESDDDDDDDD